MIAKFASSLSLIELFFNVFFIVSPFNIELLNNLDRLKSGSFYSFFVVIFLLVYYLLLFFSILFKLLIEPMTRVLDFLP
jgi:hypothetical protein